MADDDRAPPILPERADVIGPAKAKLLSVRPETARHLKAGTWAVVFTGWTGQFQVARGRLAKEVRASFPRLARGAELTELMQADYDTARNAGPVAAIGPVTLKREVVHWFPSVNLAVTAADATDLATLTTLLANIYTVFNLHAASIYADGTGLGAHRIAETDTLNAPALANMGQIVTSTNGYKSILGQHFRSAATNAQILLGSPPAPHHDRDAASAITVPDAFADDAGAPWADQTEASRQSVLLVANTLKKKLNEHMGLRALAGTVPTGTKFRVDANPIAVPPIVGGEYEAIQDVYVRTGTAFVDVPCRALAAGAAGNLPRFSPTRTALVTATGSLYDAAETLRFAPFAIRAAGGTAEQTDAQLLAAGLSNGPGRHGPTEAALLAGALRFPGLARCPILQNTSTGTSVLYAVDESWSQSSTWLAALEQNLRDERLGVGQRLSVGPVTNRIVRVELSVVLRERAHLADTKTITAALMKTLKAYFDDRPDFWIWRLNGIRGVCTRAHVKIHACVGVSVRDAEGLPLEEPTAPTAGQVATHWWLPDGAVDVAYDALS